jgi:dTDP-glucose 4,6-dehydratase
MSWIDRRVFVTGAGGFIGSHLVEALVQAGADVTAFVRYNSRSDWGLVEDLPKEFPGRLHVEMGDLRDGDTLRRSIRDTETLFHLGSLIAIPYSYASPRDVVETNVIGTLNVLQAAADNGIERVVHTSTSEVYGTALYVPIDEVHPLQGQSPYSASKIGADKLAEAFYRSYDLPVSTVRPFNTYGPRQSARAIIPTLITQVLSSGTVRVGSLHPTRDFTYVLDTVRGFLAVAESDATVGTVTNLGSNREISIGDLIERIGVLAGRTVTVVPDDERLRPKKSEVDRLVCDNTRAREVIGWHPTVDLDQGLIRTLEWIGNSLVRYKPGIYAR